MMIFGDLLKISRSRSGLVPGMVTMSMIFLSMLQVVNGLRIRAISIAIIGEEILDFCTFSLRQVMVPSGLVINDCTNHLPNLARAVFFSAKPTPNSFTRPTRAPHLAPIRWSWVAVFCSECFRIDKRDTVV